MTMLGEGISEEKVGSPLNPTLGVSRCGGLLTRKRFHKDNVSVSSI
jgi:hypothetical protein